MISVVPSKTPRIPIPDTASMSTFTAPKHTAQRELQQAVGVPLVSSSLLQQPRLLAHVTRLPPYFH